MRALEAVHLRHLYVKKDDVVGVGVGAGGLNDLTRILDTGDGDRLPVLGSVACDHLRQLITDVLLVIDYGDVQHRPSLISVAVI